MKTFRNSKKNDMTGEEVRKILADNHINLAWLAEQLGITPQGIQSRLNVKNFKSGYLMEITRVLGKDIFGSVSGADFETNQQPILDIRVCAGDGIGLEGDENKIIEYVSIPAFSGCKGLSVYGESMWPTYKPGDIIFVRQIIDKQDIDFGRPYLVITSEDRLLKNLYQSKLGNDYLRLCAANTELNQVGERLYPDRDIKADKILFLYKVVGSMRREQI